MSSPVIWILFPGLAGVVLFILQKYRRAVIFTGTLLAFLLGVLAWQLPIGRAISLGMVSLQLSDTLTIFGRQFVLNTKDQSILILIYLGLAFWFAGSLTARVSRMFIPLGLAIAGLITAVLAVEPFLYAALFIELIVLVSIPLLVSPGNLAGRGVIRYLVFQTLGFPFILFAGWSLGGMENGLLSPVLSVFSYVMLGLGFWFLMGIFPFHSWIPMLSEQSHPYSVAFLLYKLTLGISLFALGIFDRYGWLRETIGLFQLLEIAGVMMIITGGIGAAFERHLGRLMSYGVLVEIGISILAIRVGLVEPGENTRLGIFFATLYPRALSLGVWALAAVTISRLVNSSLGDAASPEKLTFKNIQGAARRFPIAAIGLLLAQFSLAGFPLLVGFPVRLALWTEIAHDSTLIAALALSGFFGLIVGGFRTMAVLVMGSDDQDWETNERPEERLLLGLGGIALVVMGVFPQIFTPLFARMAEAFLQALP